MMDHCRPTVDPFEPQFTAIFSHDLVLPSDPVGGIMCPACACADGESTIFSRSEVRTSAAGCSKQ